MKRSVAVLGSTPPFIRWAVWHECPLREKLPAVRDRAATGHFTDRTFRLLRGLREASRAFEEKRTVGDIAFHPELLESFANDEKTPALDAKSLRGFSIQEITEAFGGVERVAETCRGCPANVNPVAMKETVPRDGWAGCFGMLAADGTDVERKVSGHTLSSVATAKPDESLIQRLDHHVQSDDELRRQCERLLGGASFIWHHLWREQWLEGERLALARDLFERTLVKQESTALPQRRFARALRRANEFGLVLRVDAIASGYSDGQRWRWSDACPQCRYETTSDWTRCPVCQWASGPETGRSFKVLGTRPYLRLAEVLGEAAVLEQVEKWKAT